MQNEKQKGKPESANTEVVPHVSYVDAIGATLVALLLLGLLAGFLWLSGLSGGRYVLSLVLVAAGLTVWAWWQLVRPRRADEAAGRYPPHVK